jgi:hypothetical protein
LRFETVGQAKAALDELFTDVKVAVIAGNMDTEEAGDDYQIVVTNDRN